MLTIDAGSSFQRWDQQAAHEAFLQYFLMLTEKLIILGMIIWYHGYAFGYVKRISHRDSLWSISRLCHFALPSTIFQRANTRLFCSNIDDSKSTDVKSSSKSKQKEIKPKFVLNPEDIVETVAKGGGPGGQSINKSSNRVRLQHIPTGIIVTCQDFRDLTSNRKHAMTMLQQKVDFAINGASSKIAKKIDKIRKQKSKRKSRTKAKLSEKNASYSSGQSTADISDSPLEEKLVLDEEDDEDEEEELDEDAEEESKEDGSHNDKR
jgi:protein subunit release factor B